jgi:hypothetical protein
MSYSAPSSGQQVRIRSGKDSLLLATFKSDGIVVNSSLEFNLANELKRFFEKAREPESISLQITEGEKILKRDYPEPDGLGVMDAADLIASKARIQCALDLLLSSNLPDWVDNDKATETKLSVVQLIESCTEQIDSKLPRPNNDRPIDSVRSE